LGAVKERGLKQLVYEKMQNKSRMLLRSGMWSIWRGGRGRGEFEFF